MVDARGYHAGLDAARRIPPLPTTRSRSPDDSHGPTPVGQFAPVADLIARAREIERTSRRIIPLLPMPLRDHVCHAGVRGDHVLLLVESSAWATRARMDSSGILAAVRGVGLAAASVTARIAPRPTPSDASPPTGGKPRPPAGTVRAAAAAIADPDLRSLFLELANLTGKPPATR